MALFTFDPTDYRVWFDDFDKFTAADWTVTSAQAGAGSSSAVVQNLDGGQLLITNDAADDDNYFAQWTKETFKWESGKRLFFKTRFKVSDATQSDIAIGLQITDTTPLAVTDGIYFRKADGSTTVSLVVCKNSTESTATVGTLANDTFVTLSFYYDGATSKIFSYFNDTPSGFTALTNVVDDEELAVSIGLQNGEAVAKTMTLDYVLAVKER